MCLLWPSPFYFSKEGCGLTALLHCWRVRCGKKMFRSLAGVIAGQFGFPNNQGFPELPQAYSLACWSCFLQFCSGSLPRLSTFMQSAKVHDFYPNERTLWNMALQSFFVVLAAQHRGHTGTAPCQRPREGLLIAFVQRAHIAVVTGGGFYRQRMGQKGSWRSSSTDGRSQPWWWLCQCQDQFFTMQPQEGQRLAATQLGLS